MDTLLKMGPVTLALRDFPMFAQFPFRDWKLDAFTVTEGTPDLTVRYENAPISPIGEPVYREHAVYAHRQLYTLPDGQLLWQQTYRDSLQLQLVVSRDRKTITVTADETNTFGMAVLESLTFLVFFLFLQKDVLSFHGVLLEAAGKGLVIAADSGVGKTTHARLWRDHKNAWILNGDRSSCYRCQGKWLGFGTPWCGTSGEYLNRQVPISALVVLERSYVNQVAELQGAQKLQKLLPHVLLPQFDSNLTEQAWTLLEGFLADIPVLLLQCTPEVQAVEVLQLYLENRNE